MVEERQQDSDDDEDRLRIALFEYKDELDNDEEYDEEIMTLRNKSQVQDDFSGKKVLEMT